MLDTYTGDLLAVAKDALQAPEHLSPQELSDWYSHTLRNRLPLILEALGIASEEQDMELATQMIDQAIAEHPTTRSTPKLPLRRPYGTPPTGGLLVPERVLCDLLYRHWAMTIEGTEPNQKFVARRPFGWKGEGDPFERITASTRPELLRLLAHRHLGTGDSSSDTKPKPGTPEPPKV
ncbi:hypothetical protein [Nocardiopsis prasina]|uniref:hypothetical protein n=1 Tax=Nocardiopsis prasina TaxID=2015 RepID=UPI0003455231|nr:hypothetical protein [Nocardiopsis prasina]